MRARSLRLGRETQRDKLIDSIKEVVFNIPGLGQGIGATVDLGGTILLFMVMALVLSFTSSGSHLIPDRTLFSGRMV